jgi:predicted membrane protein
MNNVMYPFQSVDPAIRTCRPVYFQTRNLKAFSLMLMLSIEMLLAWACLDHAARADSSSMISAILRVANTGCNFLQLFHSFHNCV